MICKFKKIFTFSLIAFSLFFIGNVVNAKGTMFLGNGVVLNQCTGSTCAYPTSAATNIRFIGDSTNFEVDHKYTFKLNFSATTGMASPALTDCGLNVNGAYVSPESRNSGRINYECNQGYTRCDSTYASTIVWTATSTLSNVPYFIQCDMTPSGTTYTYTNFTMSISDSDGSVIQAIDNNTDRMIEVNNYNANQNNANRDRNTNKITDKIQDFMDAVGTGINNIISGLTTLGSNIVSGIGTAISNGVNALISAMDGLQMGINAVISKLGEIGSAIVNKIGELIGTQEVCTIYYKTQGINVINGEDNLSVGRFDSSGNLVSTNSFRTTPYINIPESDSPFNISVYANSSTSSYVCFYSSNKTLLSCSELSYNTLNNFQFTSTSSRRFYRYSFPSGNNTSTSSIGNCHKTGLGSVFQKISDFFDSFKNFVGNLFNNTIGNVWEDLNNINKIQDTPVTDLILMPLSLIDAFHTALSSNSCSGYTIPFDFTGGNNTLTLPCINLESYLGSTLWSAIDLILMGLMIYSIAMMCVSFFESWSSLHDTFDFLYNVGPNKGR